MPRTICLETQQGEVFVNLDQVCQALVTVDSVTVEFAGGQVHTFNNAAAHTLIQALRHEERRTAREA
jgi:hypothetical protein